MSSVNSIGMDIQAGQGPVSDSTIRDRNPSPFSNLSRESSLASLGRATPYHDRMDTDMDFPPSKEESNLELSYETEQEKALQAGMVANQQVTTRPQPNPNFGVVLSTPFPFTVPSSTLLQIPRTLKCLLTSLLSTLKTNRSMVTWSTISLILMV